MAQGKLTRRAFSLATAGTFANILTTRAASSTPVPADASGAAVYRVGLTAGSLPVAPIAVGAAGVQMAAGTIVTYPQGSAGRSVAIDHVVSGGYRIETDSDLVHIDATGATTSIAAGATTEVATGETIVILQNEALQQFTAGDAETRTITAGLFSLDQGSNERTVSGSLSTAVLGGMILPEVPEAGVTVTLVPTDAAGDLADALIVVPITLQPGGSWTMAVLPIDAEATPIA